MRFHIHILGCGASLPANGLNPTSQLLHVHEKYFLIDCGEGTQMRLREHKVRMQRIGHIFISHMHGDHVFGLPGLLCTMHLLGRTARMHLYGPPELEPFVKGQLQNTGTMLVFPLEFHVMGPDGGEVLYEDNSLTISTMKLHHSAPTCGFLVKEKQPPLNLIKEVIEQHQIPIAALPSIKAGADYIDEERGIHLKNKEITHPPKALKSYAFCSDTAPYEPLLEQVKGVDLLYHEATFLDDMKDRAAQTLHSTASQAAGVAKAAGVKRLLLGHFSARYKALEPFLDEACAIFEQTELAEEGSVIAL